MKVLSLHPKIVVEGFEPLATTEKNAKMLISSLFFPFQVQTSFPLLIIFVAG